MSPHQARVRSLYLLIGLNLAMAAMMVFVLVQGLRLRSTLHDTVAENHAGCVRGNVLRGAARLILLSPAVVTVESRRIAGLPELVDQPCDTIYPGGAR